MRALCDYEAKGPDELSFSLGDIMLVHERVFLAKRWSVELNDKKGFIPCDLVVSYIENGDGDDDGVNGVVSLQDTIKQIQGENLVLRNMLNATEKEKEKERISNGGMEAGRRSETMTTLEAVGSLEDNGTDNKNGGKKRGTKRRLAQEEEVGQRQGRGEGEQSMVPPAPSSSNHNHLLSSAILKVNREPVFTMFSTSAGNHCP